MMGAAKRPAADEPLFAGQKPRDTVNFCGFQSFALRKPGENRGKRPGKECLARARRARHEDIVAPCRRNFQSPFGQLLPADELEIPGCNRLWLFHRILLSLKSFYFGKPGKHSQSSAKVCYSHHRDA